MENSKEKKETDEIKKIKKFLLGLGFICNSSPNAQHLIYSKKRDVIIIKNKRK